MSEKTSLFMSDVRNSIKKWLRLGKKPMLSRWIPDADRARVMRLRTEFSKDLLSNQCFTDACQFMNEQIVENIAACDALDTQRLTVLKLRLELVSEFPQVLSMFIDQYEELKMMEVQREKNENLREVI